MWFTPFLRSLRGLKSKKKKKFCDFYLSLSLFSWLSMLPKLLAVKKFVLI